MLENKMTSTAAPPPAPGGGKREDFVRGSGGAVVARAEGCRSEGAATASGFCWRMRALLPVVNPPTDAPAAAPAIIRRFEEALRNDPVLT